MDHRRLQAAASAYPYLRGLFAMPAGLLWVVAALGNWSWGPFRHAGVFIAAVAVVGGLCVLASRHYDRHFGRVTPTQSQQLKATGVAAAGVALMVAGSLLLRSRVSWSLDLPVNAIPAMFATLMLIYYASLTGLAVHHWLIWGTLLAAGALPVWNGADPSNIGLVLTGVAVSLNGFFDHRQLVRSLDTSIPPVPGADHAG